MGKNFIQLPVEVIKDFRGKAGESQKLDDDMEPVFKPIECSAEDCGFVTTSIKEIRDHFDEHDDDELDKDKFRATPEIVNTTTANTILDILNALGNKSPDAILGKLRRNADSMHAGEVWKATWLAIQENRTTITLHKKQYRWLHDLLARKVNEKGVKEEDKLSVADAIFGLSSYSTLQTLMIPSERDEIEEDDAEPAELKAVEKDA